MKSSTLSITFAAMVLVAAFAGIVIVADDEADAAGYTVTYKVDGMTYSKPAESATITLPDLADIGASAKAGESFIGWTVEGDDTIYAVGSTYKISDGKDTPGTGAVTFVAKIDPDKYTVTFAYADGTAILTKADLAYDSTLTLPAKATSVAAGKVLEFRQIDGQIFIGWALADEPELVVIASTEKTIKVVGDADYVPVYVHDPVLTFIVDGTQTYKHTEYGAVLPTAPSKDGFSFVGWSDGEITIPDADLASYVAILLDDVTLTAVWEPAVYTVQFVVDGEVVATQSVKHGDVATEPKFVPAKDGYSFTAWSVDSKAYDFATPVTGDMTITASFEKTPVPAPTGLKDPTVQMILIIVGTIVLALIALVIWKRDAIRAALVKKLDKGNNGGSA